MNEQFGQKSDSQRSDLQKSGPRRDRIAIAVGVAIVVAVLVWLLVKGDDNKTSEPKRATPAAASVADLRSLSNQVGHPIYWAGSRKGYTYELSQTKDGSIYIRYLPPGVQVGAGGANYLTVGTYPNPKAFNTVKQASRQPNETIKKVSRGGLAVANLAKPGSVYVARPGDRFLVEVYDPSRARAFTLVTSGKVVPVS